MSDTSTGNTIQPSHSSSPRDRSVKQAPHQATWHPSIWKDSRQAETDKSIGHSFIKVFVAVVIGFLFYDGMFKTRESLPFPLRSSTPAVFMYRSLRIPNVSGQHLWFKVITHFGEQAKKPLRFLFLPSGVHECTCHW